MKDLQTKLAELTAEYETKRAEIIRNHKICEYVGVQTNWSERRNDTPTVSIAITSKADIGRLLVKFPPKADSFRHCEYFYNPEKPYSSLGRDNDSRVLTFPIEFGVKSDVYGKSSFKLSYASEYKGTAVHIYQFDIPLELFADYVKQGRRKASSSELSTYHHIWNMDNHDRDNLPCHVFKTKVLQYVGGHQSLMDMDVIQDIMDSCIAEYNAIEK